MQGFTPDQWMVQEQRIRDEEGERVANLREDERLRELQIREDERMREAARQRGEEPPPITR
jgi:hypothetical protein